MVKEEDSLGADSTNGHTLEGEGASVFEMSRQGVIDALSGNTRRVVQQEGGQLITVIERIDPTGSGEGADLFTPPAASPRGIEPPSHP